MAEAAPAPYVPPIALDHRSQKKKVPRLIHYVWVGGTIPPAYMQAIAETVDDCPSFKVMVWLSKKMSFHQDDYDANVQAVNDAEATVKTIDKLYKTEYSATEAWAQDLEWGWKDGVDGAKKPNFGAVSDIARSVILSTKGGIYIDTDCQPKEKLNKWNDKVPFGFQAICGDDSQPAESRSNLPSNCVMISIKDGRFINCYRQWINDQYGSVWNQGLKKSELRKIYRGPHGYDRGHVECKTILMTGPSALGFCALQKLTVKGIDVAQLIHTNGCTDELSGLAANPKHFTIRYDNTWLQD